MADYLIKGPSLEEVNRELDTFWKALKSDSHLRKDVEWVSIAPSCLNFFGVDPWGARKQWMQLKRVVQDDQHMPSGRSRSSPPLRTKPGFRKSRHAVAWIPPVQQNMSRRGKTMVVLNEDIGDFLKHLALWTPRLFLLL
jgi:hypothetical protein